MKRILDQAQLKWKGLAPQRRILLGAVLATLVIGGFVLNSKMNQVDWAVLYANVDDTTASDILAKLDAHGIQHQLAGNGTRILVPRESLDTTRLALAGEGVTGQAVPKGFDQVFDNQGMATTDFAQKVNYERGLEGELAKTLLTMDPVKGANVQLSIPEKSVFVGASTDPTDKPTASVLLDLKRPLTEAEVNTVASLMSSSVPGLELSEVTVASTDGTLLKAAGASDAAGGAGAGSTALEVTQKYETDLSQRLTNLVRSMTGSVNATVEVRADLDYQNSTTQSQKIDPTTQAVTAEDHTEETWTGTGVAPGGVAGVDGGPSGATSDSTGDYSKIHDTKTYDAGDKVVTTATNNTPTVKKLGIAVVIPTLDPNGALTSQMVSDAIAAAANLDTTRGDAIQVVESVAAAAADKAGTDTTGLVTPAAVATGGVSPLFVVIAAVAGAAMVFLLGFFGRKRKAKKAAAAALAAALDDPTLMALGAVVGEGSKSKKEKKVKTKKKGKGDDSDDLSLPQLVGPDPVADKVAMEEIRSDLEKILAESPESLASLLSTWMTK